MSILTADSHKLFMMYAEDAPNWDGNPWVSDGNVHITKEQRGNLSDLVKKNMIQICDSDSDSYIEFTDKGAEYAASHGFPVREGDQS
jgi:hypothetical protein